MFVLPVERYQEACEAFNAFTKDVSQLTQQMWDEVHKRQFGFLRLCLDSGERQLRGLGNGFSWNEQILEQSDIAIDFWRQSLNNWRELSDSFTETSTQLRTSVNRIGPFWTAAAWQEAGEKVAGAMNAARQEALEQITETVGTEELPRRRANERKNKVT